PSPGRLALFRQRSDGSFPLVPDELPGGTLGAPAHVLAADLNGDGALDLACANRDGNDVALFLAGPAGLQAAPSLRLGGGGSTDSPRALALEDVDGDGQLDVAAACANENALALFFQHAPGAFSTSPDLVLTHVLVSLPTTLASADLDHDGDLDLICGAQGGPDIVV